MEVTMTLDRDQLVFLESTRVHITLHNRRDAVVTIVDPIASGASPVLRLHDIARRKTKDLTADAAIVRLDPDLQPAFGGPPIRRLQPDERVELDYDLLAWVGTLEPGRYTIQALVDRKDVHGESAPIAFTIAPLQLGALHRQANTSNAVPHWDIAFAHEQANHAGTVIVVRTFKLDGWMQLLSSVRIGTGPAGAVPLSSTSPPGYFAQGHWVTWLDGDAVVYAYTDEGRVLKAPARTSVPHASTLIEPPLHALALDHPPASLTVFVITSASSKDWQIAALVVDPAGHATVADSVPGIGARPRWTAAAQFAGGLRYALAISQDASAVNLNTVRWPDKDAPRWIGKLASWNGELVGAAATSSSTYDQLGGATVVRVPDADKQLRLISWRLDGTGKLQANVPRTIHWPQQRGIRHLVLRVDPDGGAFGLIQASHGEWFLFDAEGATVPVPNIPVALRTIDLAFMHDHIPVVQLADDSGRVRYQWIDGSPVADW